MKSGLLDMVSDPRLGTDEARPRRPRVSVVVPVYNCEDYLERCLASLQQQSERDIEIIVVDDGSTDGSLDVARKFLGDERFVLVENETNLGTFHTRVRGFSTASGDFLGSVDADDWVHVDFITDLLGTADKSACDVAQCRLVSILPDGRRRKVPWADAGMRTFRGPDIIEGAIARDFWHIACNKIFKRDLFEKARWFLEAIDRSVVVADDKLLMLPILFYAEKLGSTKRRLYSYRQRPGSATNNRTLAHDLRHIQDSAYVDRKLLEFLKASDTGATLVVKMELNRRDEIRLATFNATAYPPGSCERETLFQHILDIYGAETLAACIPGKAGDGNGEQRWARTKAYGLHEIYAHVTLAEIAMRRYVSMFHPRFFPSYDVARRLTVTLFRAARFIASGGRK